MLQRIILHWTAGADGVNETESDSYNFIVGRDGSVTNGSHPPEAQVPPLKYGHYAAHTLNCNSYSIGVSLDAMADAKEVPFNAGKYPITEEQLGAAAQLVASLCLKYGIPVTRETVLSHAEVQRTLGIAQRQKWDISWLPGMEKPGDAIVVGDKLRRMVSDALADFEREKDRSEKPIEPLPTLRRGMRTVHVATAQSALIAKKYLSGKGSEKADGDFGALTEAAVKAFQRDKGLKQDGVVGPKTWEKLNEGLKK